jgi:hypothetical protein
VTPEENIRYLQEALELAKRGSEAIANAMAEYIVWRTREITLRRTFHAPGEWYSQRPGEPPAYASGKLAEGMFYKPASSGFRATALVGNKVEYSRILEFGCVVTPRHNKYMHWTDSRGSWYHEFLVVPEHPFLTPTIEEAIDDDSLLEIAIETFKDYDP